MWFAVGVFVAFLLILGLSDVVATAGSGVLNLVLPIFGCFCGGAIAGRSLRLGTRGVAGFAVAFALTLPVLVLRLIGIQGLGSHEPFWTLVQVYSGTGAVAFAVMGAVGVLIAGLGYREVGIAAATFGGAGLLGGLLLVLTQILALEQDFGRDINRVLLLAGSGAFLILPAALGGTVLTRRLASRNRPSVSVPRPG